MKHTIICTLIVLIALITGFQGVSAGYTSNSYSNNSSRVYKVTNHTHGKTLHYTNGYNRYIDTSSYNNTRYNNSNSYSNNSYNSNRIITTDLRNNYNRYNNSNSYSNSYSRNNGYNYNSSSNRYYR